MDARDDGPPCDEQVVTRVTTSSAGSGRRFIDVTLDRGGERLARVGVADDASELALGLEHARATVHLRCMSAHSDLRQTGRARVLPLRNRGMPAGSDG